MNQPPEKIVLFANGDLPASERILAQLSPEDQLIAVDGGLQHLTQHNLTPDLIIGDLDSADPSDVKRFRDQGVEVRQYPPEKDETDLELALDAAIELQPDCIWILGALGKRIDQTLANIFLLARGHYSGNDLRLIDGHQEIFLIRDSGQIEASPASACPYCR